MTLGPLPDKYGSPTMGEMASFSRALQAQLESRLGAAAMGELEIEVSSPVRGTAESWCAMVAVGVQQSRQGYGRGDVSQAACLCPPCPCQGAERILRLPHELARFSSLPLSVRYVAPDDARGKVTVSVLRLVSGPDPAGLTRWSIATTRQSRRRRGARRAASRRHEEDHLELPLAALRQVNIFLDV